MRLSSFKLFNIDENANKGLRKLIILQYSADRAMDTMDVSVTSVKFWLKC